MIVTIKTIDVLIVQLRLIKSIVLSAGSRTRSFYEKLFTSEKMSHVA